MLLKGWAEENDADEEEADENESRGRGTDDYACTTAEAKDRERNGHEGRIFMTHARDNRQFKSPISIILLVVVD